MFHFKTDYHDFLMFSFKIGSRMTILLSVLYLNVKFGLKPQQLNLGVFVISKGKLQNFDCTNVFHENIVKTPLHGPNYYKDATFEIVSLW